LGGGSLAVLEQRGERKKAVLEWDKSLDIKYAMPFRDLKPEVKLGLYNGTLTAVHVPCSKIKTSVTFLHLIFSLEIGTLL